MVLRIAAGGGRWAGGEGLAALATQVISPVVARAFASSLSTKKVKKAARKLLRHTLQGLMEIYPRHYRSVSGDGGNEWAEAQDAADTRVDWHVPTLNEVKAAKQLLGRHLTA